MARRVNYAKQYQNYLDERNRWVAKGYNLDSVINESDFIKKFRQQKLKDSHNIIRNLVEKETWFSKKQVRSMAKYINSLKDKNIEQYKSLLSIFTETDYNKYINAKGELKSGSGIKKSSPIWKHFKSGIIQKDLFKVDVNSEAFRSAVIKHIGSADVYEQMVQDYLKENGKVALDPKEVEKFKELKKQMFATYAEHGDAITDRQEMFFSIWDELGGKEEANEFYGY